VSLSNDGSRVAVGARYNDGGGTYSGHVRVYQYSNNSWNQLGSDVFGTVDSGGNWFDAMGSSVSLSGDGSTFAAGAPFHGYVGAVRVYELEESS